MSEQNTVVVNDELQNIVSSVLTELDNSHKLYMKSIEETMKEKYAILKALQTIRLPGVEVPDINKYALKYQCNVKVSDIRMFPVLQKLLNCKFEHHGKTPIGDGRKNMIRVSMAIKDNDNLRYELNFTYERKLTKNDKCKVVTETSKRTAVVCTNK